MCRFPVKLLATCLLLLSLFSSKGVEGESILFFLGISTYSHRLGVWPLVEELTERGHNVTVISAYVPKSPNPKVQDLVPEAFQAFVKKYLVGVSRLGLRLSGKSGTWTFLPSVVPEAFEMLVKDQGFLRWYENASVDLVFVDPMYADFALGLAYKLKAKSAVFATSAPYMWQSDSLGFSPEASWLPNMETFHPDGNQMTFLQRMSNTLNPVYWEFFRRWKYLPAIEKILREGLNLSDMPSFGELEKNVTLMLTNTHFTEEYARSVPPNVISIGGMHCGRYKAPLPKDLEEFLDSSGDDGFIYISFGSALKTTAIPLYLRQVFFNVMRGQPTRFVFKWDGELPDDMPDNVFPAFWLPQQTILGHPKIKGFISHGGVMSIQESICDAVPIIILPVFADQDYNANRVHQREYGIKLEWKGLTEEDLSRAISNILHDPRYKKNMHKVSQIFLDRQSKPLDLAVWWTEYILRHDHAELEFLKPLGIHQSWYKRRSLDVWFFIFSIVSFPVWILVVCSCKSKASSKVNSKGVEQNARIKSSRKKVD